MTAPKTCEHCADALDAGEICDCRNEAGNAMEFVMATDLEKALPKTIDFNFEELKAQLAESLTLYTGLVVTEAGIKPAKEDRAKLNKLREALENKRKEVKRECMAPYTDFEAKVKELVGLIDQPIAAIDGQLKAFEEKRRSEKRAEVLAVYEESIGELRDILPFERLWRDEWYNVAVSLKKIRTAISDAVGKAASDLEVLNTVESEFAEAVKLKYLDTLDISAALQERTRLQAQAAKLREYEGRPGEGASDGPLSQPAADSSPKGGASGTAEETVYLLRFECQITKTQAAVLARFMKDNHITYRRI